jgi:hypothetical protein
LPEISSFRPARTISPQAPQVLDDCDRGGSDEVVAKTGKVLSGERAMITVKRLRTADCMFRAFAI